METDTPTTSAPPDSEPSASAREAHACPNCEHAFVGSYCPACGQKAALLRQPVHHFLRDAITEYFGIDGRLWTSLWVLLTKPGRLTQEYLAGRRVRHLRPLRLYLTSTLLFFFLLAVLDPVEQVRGIITQGIETGEEGGAMPAGDRTAEIDSALAAYVVRTVREEQEADSLAAEDLTWVIAADTVAGADLERALDEVEAALDAEARPRALRRLRWQREQLAAFPPDSLVRVEDWRTAAEILFPSNNVNINMPAWLPRSRPTQRMMEARTSEERAAAIADLSRNAIGQLPTVMFLLLPVFALLLKVVYLRRDWYYSEHLVFALHTHAFAFLVFTFIAVLMGFSGGAAWAGITGQVLVFGIPIYFFVAQKRVYGQSWLKTGAKALLLGWLYGSLLVLGVVLALILAASF